MNRRNEPLSEALLNFYTFPLVAVIFSLLEEKREGHLEELYLQVVLRRVQFKSRSSICFTFQDEKTPRVHPSNIYIILDLHLLAYFWRKSSLLNILALLKDSDVKQLRLTTPSCKC